MIYYKDADFSRFRESVKYRRNHQFSNLVSGFDIETSAVFRTDAQGSRTEYAFMYEWTFGVEDLICYGRTWDELREFLLNLRADLCLSHDFKLIVFDQRLKYEFQFFKFELWINDDDERDFLARDARTIIKCLVNDVFQFRASDEFSEESLDFMGETLGIPKIKGYDYARIRHALTPLDDFELSYCERDVRILLEYFKREREKYGEVKRIPLTFSRTIKDKIFANFQEEADGRTVYANQFKDRPEDMLMLGKIQKAFFGAHSFSSFHNRDEVFSDVWSCDRSSDYGAQMILNKYPCRKLKPAPIPEDWRELLSEKYEKKAYLVTFSVQNVANIYDFFCFLPENKEWDFDPRDVELDHDGKIRKVKRIIMTLTDIDFKLFNKFYSFDGESLKIYELYTSHYAYLPHYIVRTIVQLYLRKKEAKDIYNGIKKERLPTAAEESAYNRDKTPVSRVYGVFVQKPLRFKYKFSRQSGIVEPTKDEEGNPVEEFIKKDYEPVLYHWGAWVTAYARRAELLTCAAIDLYIDPETGEPKNRKTLLGGDTDSVHFLNSDSLSIIHEYNQEVKEKLRRFCDMYRLSGWKFEDLEGIGEYEIEHRAQMKVIGVKKYAYVDNNGNFRAKIAGLSRENEYFDQYKTNAEKMEALDPDMIIPAELAKNKSLTYYDTPVHDTVTDWQGIPAEIDVKSFIVLSVQRFDSNHGRKIGLKAPEQVLSELRPKKLIKAARKGGGKNGV